MVELAIRLGSALLAVGAALANVGLPFDPAWRASAFFATYSLLSFGLERRGMRNAGVSGLFAVADSGVTLILLAASGQIEHFGFLALVPPAYAALKHSADAVAMAPIVAALYLMASNLFQGPGWTPVVLGQTVGTLLLGLLGAQRTRILKVKEIVEVPGESPLSESDLQSVFDLREKYRVMRDHAQDVERKSRRDRTIVRLREALDGKEGGLEALCRRLREVLDVQGLAIFTALDDLFLPQCSAGAVPNSVRDESLHFPDFLGEWQLKEKLAAQLVSMGCEGSDLAVIVLKVRGRVEGLLVLHESRRTLLDQAIDQAGEINEYLTRMIAAELDKEKLEVRTRHAELLYHVAGVTQGADSVDHLAMRVVRELWEGSRIDHVSAYFFNDGDIELAAQKGATGNPLSLFDGELPQDVGQMELYAPIVGDSPAFDRIEALKRRIGSLVVLPLGADGDADGFLAVYTHRAGGIDSATLEMLRSVAQETGQALARFQDDQVRPYGLATPREFHGAVKAADSGSLVVLEVLKRDELVETFGKPALDQATRAFAIKLRAVMPKNGVMCRRADGDFMVLLRGRDEATARTWAARAAATASLIPVAQPGTRKRAPLAVKAKVSVLAQQHDWISSKESKVVGK